MDKNNPTNPDDIYFLRPQYVARVREEWDGGRHSCEAEVRLEPQFDREGHLTGFTDIERTQDWVRGSWEARLASAYVGAARELNGREPTRYEADPDGCAHIVTVGWKRRYLAPTGRWDTLAQTVTIEAVFH